MCPRLLDAILRRSSGAFVRAARERGLRARSARILEADAHKVSPDDPARILDSRTLFEEAATRAVVGDGGNLELSFSLVDELATTVETLGLARASDVPDPFRRVWVTNGAGQRIRGVVLTCRGGEVAVFCPPTDRSVTEIGSILWLRYRGFTSAVEYDLQLDDAVRLPGALVLHLKRRSGQGAIGRSSLRYPTSIPGSLQLLDNDMALAVTETETIPCLVTDISAGGMALECPILPAQGVRLRIELPLPDENEAPFAAEAVVRWAREDPAGVHDVGVAFANLPRPRVDRLDRFLRILSAEGKEGSPPRTTEDGRATPAPTPAPARSPAPRIAREKPPSSPVLVRAFAGLDLDPPDDDDPREPAAEANEGPWREAAAHELRLLEGIFHRIARDATKVCEHSLECSRVRGERRSRRVAGIGTIHISFKFAVEHRGEEREGCLLVPLADAISLVSSYLMFPLESVLQNRSLDAPDHVMKRALMQLSELVSTAIEREGRDARDEPISVRSLGCQGVRANVRPAFRYVEGTELLVGRSRTRFADCNPFELILLLPDLDAA